MDIVFLKMSEILFLSKVFKLFTHDMGCFETELGMLFHVYKGLLVTHEVLEKIEKNSSKIAVFSLWGAPLLSMSWKTAIFELFFSIFLKSS